MSSTTHAPDTVASIDPSRPLDSVLATLIGDARANRRGFALEVAGDPGDRKLSVVQTLPPVDTYVPPVALRSHQLEDVASLIAFARKYGSRDRSAVIYNDEGVVLVVDDSITDGQRERISTSFAFSHDWLAWARVFSNQVEHRPMLEFLLIQQQNLVDVKIIDAMRLIRATSQVKLDSDLRVESETVGVIFAATAGEELVRFPREFSLRIPVLDIDVDNVEAWAPVQVRVEIRLPTEPKQPVRFILLAPTLQAVRRARVNRELDTLRAALDGWLVVRGKHQETPRVIGRPKS